MNCQEVTELLSAYQDRELAPEEMTAIAEHLEHCPACSSRSSLMANLSQVLRHWEGVRATEQLRAAVIERARTSGGGPRGSAAGPGARLFLAVLAAVLLAGGLAALAVWWHLADRGGSGAGTGSAPGERAPAPPAAVGTCLETAGRVEFSRPGSPPVEVRGRCPVLPRQLVKCWNGSAAQVELAPAQPGAAAAEVMLKGPGEMRFLPEGLRLESGTLVFRVPAGAALGVDLAGRWRLAASAGGPSAASGAAGLVSLSPLDGRLRLAVLTGGAELAGPRGQGRLTVAAGQEIRIEPDGRIGPPQPVGDPAEFRMLSGEPAGTGE